MGRVLGVAVPEVVLDGAQVGALIGQVVAAGMAEHVRPDPADSPSRRRAVHGPRGVRPAQHDPVRLRARTAPLLGKAAGRNLSGRATTSTLSLATPEPTSYIPGWVYGNTQCGWGLSSLLLYVSCRTPCLRRPRSASRC